MKISGFITATKSTVELCKRVREHLGLKCSVYESGVGIMRSAVNGWNIMRRGGVYINVGTSGGRDISEIGKIKVIKRSLIYDPVKEGWAEYLTDNKVGGHTCRTLERFAGGGYDWVDGDDCVDMYLGALCYIRDKVKRLNKVGCEIYSVKVISDACSDEQYNKFDVLGSSLDLAVEVRKAIGG